MQNPIIDQNKLSHIFDANNFRKIGHELIDLLANHIDNIQTDRTEKVIPYKSPTEELAFWQAHFASDAGAIDSFEKILAHSIKVHHPRCVGHQVAAPAPLASLSGIMVDLLSNGMGVYEMGMAANAIEKVICDFMAKEIGYTTESSGLMTSGGTLANLTALLAARKANAPSDVWQEGHQEKLAIMVSEEAHYCVDRAARIMSLGAKGIIKVPVDSEFRLQTELLPTYLAKAKANGLHVFAVIGCAASTATGSYDDLEGIAQFCKTHQIWFHVDGAHGGGVVFSKKYASLAKGIHLADSVVIDFHKMLLTPALTTALIFKDGKDAYKTFTQKAQYLWDVAQSEEWYNSGKRTFECTKLMMAIKVYIVLKAHGIEVFGQNIDHLYDLARTFAELIRQKLNFELAHDPASNIVNYRYTPTQNKTDLNTLNAMIRQRIMESGKFYIVQTVIKDQRYLRSAIMNPLTTKDDLEALLEEIETTAFQIMA